MLSVTIDEENYIAILAPGPMTNDLFPPSGQGQTRRKH